jgi:hypothetical protein
VLKYPNDGAFVEKLLAKPYAICGENTGFDVFGAYGSPSI